MGQVDCAPRELCHRPSGQIRRTSRARPREPTRFAPAPTAVCTTAPKTWVNGPAAVASLTPPTATKRSTVAAQNTHTVTARITDANHTPLADQHLTFSMTAGPNMGKPITCVPATCVTGAAGTVTACYAGTTAGTDTIRVCTDNNLCATAQKTWVNGPAAVVA